MLQTLQMIEMMGDLPPIKIVGVIPYVIGENSTFSMTDEVLKASLTMERVIVDYLGELGVSVEIKNREVSLSEIAQTTYIKGVDYDLGV